MTHPRYSDAGKFKDTAKSGKVLDEALEDTFPASDPLPTSPLRAGKNDKRVDVKAAPEASPPIETTDEKSASNMKAFHKVFERRRR